MRIMDGLFSRKIGATPPPGWDDFWYSLIAPKSASGVEVNTETALGASAVYNAITLLSDAAAVIPAFVFERRAVGKGRDERTEHPVHQLLHDRPNPEQTAAHFKWLLLAWALAWGQGVAWIARDKRGEPAALWPLHPRGVTIKRSETTDLLYGEVRDSKGFIANIEYTNLIHIRKFTKDGVNGVSPIQCGADSLGSVLAAERHAGAFFANGANPSGVLEHPEQLSEEAGNRLRKQWQERYGGTENAHKTIILEQGMKYSPVGVPPETAQLLGTRQFGTLEVARWFNIPPHKLKNLENAHFTNIEHSEIEWVVSSVLPWLTVFEQECALKLFLEVELATHICEFQVQGLLRGDVKTRGEFYQRMLDRGVYCINDVRSKENLNPIEGGDAHFVPLNFQPLEQAIEPKEEAPAQAFPALPPSVEPEPEEGQEEADAKVEAILRILVRDIAARVAAREIKAMAARAHKVSEDSGRFFAWADEFYLAHGMYVEHALSPLLQACNGDGIDAVNATQAVVSSGRNALSLRDPQAVVTEWQETRADEIAGILTKGMIYGNDEDSRN